MSSVYRYYYLLKRCCWAAIIITLLLVALLVRAYYCFPQIPRQDFIDIQLSKPVPSVADKSADWSVFMSRDGGQATATGATAGRFRLAGTFFEYNSGKDDIADIRKAIVDDVRTGKQTIVTEGEKVEDTLVVKVFKDHIIIRFVSGIEEQLWLTFTGYRASGSASGTTNEAGVASSQFAGADKFGGKQTGEKKWLFSRERLLDYYKELRDEPERLVKVFDSLKPVYVEGANRISGYRLGIEGESEFFKSVGLSEGDIVRSVNSMQMTSRNRAEYFISEFVADRANAFVIEVERSGKSEKFIYQVR